MTVLWLDGEYMETGSSCSKTDCDKCNILSFLFVHLTSLVILFKYSVCSNDVIPWLLVHIVQWSPGFYHNKKNNRGEREKHGLNWTGIEIRVTIVSKFNTRNRRKYPSINLFQGGYQRQLVTNYHNHWVLTFSKCIAECKTKTKTKWPDPEILSYTTAV